ncbi:MAG: hypothetical protein ABIP68_05960 [Ferruginibacter sp.]
MIKQATIYTVVCDNCGKDANEEANYPVCKSTLYVKDINMKDGWLNDYDKHYCPDCFVVKGDDLVTFQTIKEIKISVIEIILNQFNKIAERLLFPDELLISDEYYEIMSNVNDRKAYLEGIVKARIEKKNITVKTTIGNVIIKG